MSQAAPRAQRRPIALGLWVAGTLTLLVLSSNGLGAPTASHSLSLGPSAAPAHGSVVAEACLPPALAPSGGPCPAAGSAASASTGAGWVDVTGTAGTPPSARSYTRSFAYDPADGYLLTFGGYQGSYAADTWVYNGSWHQLNPTVSPLGRDHSTLIWDPVDHYMLLFGGSGTGGAYGDTWTFLAGVWTKLSTPVHPSARWSSDVVWDAADGYALLFGGCANGEVNDTWTFLGGNWTELTPSSAPGPRGNVAMSYDENMHQVVLFGGDDWYGDKYSDTWTYSAGSWTNLSLTHAPSGRSEASIAYDPWVGADVMFGGSTAAYGSAGDTWWFVEGTWSEQQPTVSPDARYFGILAIYPPTNSLVLWGGVGLTEYTDTWSYYSMNVTARAAAPSGPAPFTASLTASPSGGAAPYDVAWSLGDGGVANGTSINHTYLFPGAYQAIVTVTDANGVTDAASIWVQVLVPLSGSGVVAPLSGTAPLTVFASSNFSGGMAPVVTGWSFGGLGTATASDASFTFSTAGTYQVELTLADAAGEVQQEGWSVLVSPLPHPALSAVVSATPTIGIAPLLVGFQAQAVGGQAPFNFAWQLGDGNSSTMATLNHTYVQGGVFPVVVTISDAFGTTVTRSMTIEADPALQAFASALPDNGTAPLTVTLGATAYGGTPAYSYIWSFGDGNGSQGQSVTHTFLSAGTYPIELKVWDSLGASSSDSLQVTVAAAPIHTHPPPGATNSTSAAATQLSLPIALGVSVLVGLAAAIATAVVMRRRR